MVICHMMTSSGFIGGMMSKGFVMAWGGLLIIALVIMLAKKWLGEEEMAGMEYNWFFSILGAVIYILIVTFSCSPKWGLLIGLVSTLGLGFLGGSLAGGSS